MELVTPAAEFHSKFEFKERSTLVYDMIFDSSVLVTAHEDKCIRMLDLRSGSCVKAIVGHTDAVTSVDIISNCVVSGGADGSIRTWDLRNWNCLYEVSAHRRKYDEAVHVVKTHKNLLASGGADSVIKIFESR